MNEQPPQVNIEFDEKGMIKVPDWSQTQNEEPKAPEHTNAPEQPQAEGTFTINRHGKLDSGWTLGPVLETSNGMPTVYLMRKTEDGVPKEKSVYVNDIFHEDKLDAQHELESVAGSTVEELGEGAVEATPITIDFPKNAAEVAKTIVQSDAESHNTES